MLRSFIAVYTVRSERALHVCDGHHAEPAKNARPTQKPFYCASSYSVCAGSVMTGAALLRPHRKRLWISRKRLPKSRLSVCIYRQLAERNPAFSRSL